MLIFDACLYGTAQGGPLGSTFDSATTCLHALERYFLEPDGSFVWRGGDDKEDQWQVDGNLMDRGDYLAFVEVKGRCPEEKFDLLLEALGWPAAAIAFALPRSGRFLDEPAFRALARTESGAV